MGDFVKGPLDPTLPSGIRRGIVLHRRLDRYAQSNPSFRRSKGRIDNAFGHCKGILVDIFYDHFLARNWTDFAPNRLEDFAQQVYGFLQRDFHRLPPGLQRVAPTMIGQNWLVSYRETATVGRVLARLAGRLRRPNPLADGLPQLQRHYRGLEEDFRAFLPAAARDLQEMAAADQASQRK